MRCSNALIGFFNILMFLISIPIIVLGFWLNQNEASECEQFLVKPILVLGFFLMIVSLMGLIGGCCRLTCLMWFYMFVMFCLIVALFFSTTFTFIVTNKGAGDALAGKGYQEFRLDDYSTWLQTRVNKAENWNTLKTCLTESGACKRLINDKNTTDVKQFYQLKLSSLESGCCKPSDTCNFQYVTPVNWKPIPTSAIPDCGLWSNEPKTLCYNCESCKAGFLDTLKKNWQKTVIVEIVVLSFLIIVNCIGCCAIRNIQEENYRRYKYMYPYGPGP